jgi:hypothetical protein
VSQIIESGSEPDPSVAQLLGISPLLLLAPLGPRAPPSTSPASAKNCDRSALRRPLRRGRPQLGTSTVARGRPIERYRSAGRGRAVPAQPRARWNCLLREGGRGLIRRGHRGPSTTAAPRWRQLAAHAASRAVASVSWPWARSGGGSFSGEL